MAHNQSSGTQPSPKPWLRYAVFGVAALLLFVWLCRDDADSDTWWHLKTGQFILSHHRLPVPDPFAWTTYLGKPTYAGEEITRYFNLTHEWLAQVILYGAWAAGASIGLMLIRAAALSLFCFLAGVMAYRRVPSFYRSLGATFAAAIVTHYFDADRPQYFTYLFLALTIYLLDSRRMLWLLPPLFLIWANCHGGFFLGWVAVALYCAETLYVRWRRKPSRGDRWLWLSGLTAILISGVNPNGFRVLEVLHNYHYSALQSHITEWHRSSLTELSPFTVLLYGSILVLLYNRRRARPVDWLLLLVFDAAAIVAFRNVIFASWVGAFVLSSWLPGIRLPVRKNGIADFALITVLLAATGVLVGTGWPFQFRGPVKTRGASAADFLLQHHIQGKLFNTYEDGGYLIWRLWPQLQVFTDGRALNESVFQDMRRILFAADNNGGRSWQELLNDYAIDIILMDGFEAGSGAAFYLPAALSDPEQTDWTLVFRDDHDLIYMRRPPPDVQVLKPAEGLVAMEAQCSLLIDQGTPACAIGMTDLFMKMNDMPRARKWGYTVQRLHL